MYRNREFQRERERRKSQKHGKRNREGFGGGEESDRYKDNREKINWKTWRKK